MVVIYLKELRSYFKSIFGWLFLAVFTAIGSLYFVAINLSEGDPLVSHTISSLVVILMFVFPLLTMRSLAEEKKLKTDQLLLTAPVRVTSIVLGKFFSLVTMMLIASVVLFLGLFIMSFYGEIPFKESCLAILALVLVGSLFASIGVFLSSITEHQFVAAILTYGAFISLMIIPSALQFFFYNNKVITTIAKAIDFLSAFDNMLVGIINLKDIIYILSVIAIFLILAVRIFGRTSLQVSFVGAKKFWFSTLGLFALIAIIIGANIGIRYIPDKYIQADLTKDKKYSLTNDSKALLSSLTDEITIHVLSDKENADKNLVMYLDDYVSESDKIKVQYHSSVKEPNFYAAYTSEAPTAGSVIVVCGDKNWIVDSNDFYEVEYGFDYSTFQETRNITGIDVEGQLAAAINYVTSDESYKVYFLEGHGEAPASENTGKLLGRAGFTYDSLNLFSLEEVPSDCNVLVISGPNEDLTTGDVEKIEHYLSHGGKAVFMAAGGIYETPNYDKLLSEFGAEIKPGIIWENNPMYSYANNGFYIFESPIMHEISDSLVSSGLKNLLIQSRGFEIGDGEDVNISIDPLFESSDDSLAVVYDETGNPVDETEMENGPFALGYFATKTYEDGVAGVTVIGSPVFLYDDVDTEVAHANSKLFVNALGYMCDQTLSTTIPPKSYEPEKINVSGGIVLIYAGLLVVLLPLIEIIAGIVIFIVRRRK